MTRSTLSGHAVGEVRCRVEWIDTDASGIYHNSTVIRFVEAAEARLMTERGLDDYFPAAPRVRYEVDFESPLFFGQEVVTTVAVAHIGRTSMRFEFEVWGEAFGVRPRRRAAHGAYVTVHLSGREREGRRLSSAWPSEWVAQLTSG